MVRNRESPKAWVPAFKVAKPGILIPAGFLSFPNIRPPLLSIKHFKEMLGEGAANSLLAGFSREVTKEFFFFLFKTCLLLQPILLAGRTCVPRQTRTDNI